jgi:hypothetical protein
VIGGMEGGLCLGNGDVGDGWMVGCGELGVESRLTLL